MRKQHQQAGFSLIELLIALAIFAVLGVMIAGALKHTLTTYQALLKRQSKLEAIALTQSLMRQDISDTQPRAVYNANNEALPAVVSIPSGGFSLTTASRNNPGGWFSRSTLQRVRYQLINRQWVRQTWPTLDGIVESNPETRVLLSNVVACTTHYVGGNSQILPSWSQPAQQTIPSLPKGILVDLTLSNGTHMIGIYPIRFQQDRGVL